jgi:hypothetical protein
MFDTPDLEIDAYLAHGREKKILCDVRVWYPKLPSDDARIEVVAIGVDADTAHPEDLTHLKSVEASDDALPRFEAREVLVRQSSYRGQRLAGGTRLTIGHIGRLIERMLPMSEKVGPQIRNHVQFTLSDLDYGLRTEGSTVKYTGDRRVFKKDPRLLRVLEDDVSVEFSLERHWTWQKDGKDFISATSTPVLNLQRPSQLRGIPTEQLVRLADDTCLFLSLAARHRVLLHGSIIGIGAQVVREWRNPLNRSRAPHTEGAEGMLVNDDEVENYFVAIGSNWKVMQSAEKNALRSAVFSIHPLMETTIEARFVAMFFALEGIAKLWGGGDGTLRSKLERLLERFPVAYGMIWPLFDSPGLVGLVSIRNHLAHGRILAGEGSGAVALANDHIQVWIERFALRILGYYPINTSRDWLQTQIRSQNSVVLAHRADLWGMMKG